MSDELDELEWSDELTLSAQRYMQKLDGCNIYEPQIFLSDWSSSEIVDIATFDDHKRYVIYPERMAWSGPEEGVFDAIVDDGHTNFNLRHDLLENTFDSIGIVCNCHPTFG